MQERGPSLSSRRMATSANRRNDWKTRRSPEQREMVRNAIRRRQYSDWFWKPFFGFDTKKERVVQKRRNFDDRDIGNRIRLRRMRSRHLGRSLGRYQGKQFRQLGLATKNWESRGLPRNWRGRAI